MLSRRFLRPLLSTSCGRRSWWPQATPSYPFFLGTTSITPKVPSASLFSFFSSNATTSTSTEPHPLHTSNHPTTSSSSTSKSNPDTDSTNPSSNHGSVNEQIQQLQSELKEKSDKLTSVLVSSFSKGLSFWAPPF
ncbi:hypothetical protein HMI54_013766 [Coelomomyces lativittatus]|nr:hypothetical protein HMI54_013766 [Coelomomyces lativittatus]KAJ1497369.1 hypothetical protein HMI55_005535 [Coelomomyces lativittatus]